MAAVYVVRRVSWTDRVLQVSDAEDLTVGIDARSRRNARSRSARRVQAALQVLEVLETAISFVDSAVGVDRSEADALLDGLVVLGALAAATAVVH